MSAELPNAEVLAKWFHDTCVELAKEHNCGALPWDQITENERALQVAVLDRFLNDYGPMMAVSRKVWEASSWVWADWSIGKLDPVRMEALRLALMEYGTVLKDQMPTDPVMRPYEKAAQLVRDAGGLAHVETLAQRILALGAEHAEAQRAGLRSR